MSDEELVKALGWGECAPDISDTAASWCGKHDSYQPRGSVCNAMTDALDHAEQGMELVTPILTDLIAELRELDTALSERGQAILFLRVARIKATTRLREVQGE